MTAGTRSPLLLKSAIVASPVWAFRPFIPHCAENVRGDAKIPEGLKGSQTAETRLARPNKTMPLASQIFFACGHADVGDHSSSAVFLRPRHDPFPHRAGDVALGKLGLGEVVIPGA